MFAKERGVVRVGRPTDSTSRTSLYSNSHNHQNPWFYMHAEEVIKSSPSKLAMEIIPIRDYLFRYDRGAFVVLPTSSP